MAEIYETTKLMIDDNQRSLERLMQKEQDGIEADQEKFQALHSSLEKIDKILAQIPNFELASFLKKELETLRIFISNKDRMAVLDYLPEIKEKLATMEFVGITEELKKELNQLIEDIGKLTELETRELIQRYYSSDFKLEQYHYDMICDTYFTFFKTDMSIDDWRINQYEIQANLGKKGYKYTKNEVWFLYNLAQKSVHFKENLNKQEKSK